jgi:hypothetical protein
LNNHSSSFPSHSHDHHHQYDDDVEQLQENDDYEHISFQAPVIARAFVRNYEENSMTSSSRRSNEYDTTLADEESFKPVEYYRR